MSEPLWRWPAHRLTGAIRAGAVSAREATVSALDRVQAVNPALNAIVDLLPDEALAAADAADAARRRGDALGPLHGVPVTVKVNVDLRGRATTNGVVAFKDNIAADDSPVVANLRRAGAVIIGRTNTPAFSVRWFTDNDLHGRTYNPWSRAHTPGGSSGGASSAVAAGMGAIAHGNDLAGSVRYPAYCTGVYGLRPSFGRVPAFLPSAKDERPVSMAMMSVQGPLARHVADLRLALAAMSPGDARDPWWVPAPLAGPVLPRPLRVAMTVQCHGAPADPAVVAAALPLLAWVALFHTVDAAQAVAAFVLRAWRIATVPTLIYVLALWGVGLGGGHVLAFNLGGAVPLAWQGARGFWIASTVGLSLSAVGLVALLAWVLHQQRGAAVRPVRSAVAGG